MVWIFGAYALNWSISTLVQDSTQAKDVSFGLISPPVGPLLLQLQNPAPRMDGNNTVGIRWPTLGSLRLSRYHSYRWSFTAHSRKDKCWRECSQAQSTLLRSCWTCFLRNEWRHSTMKCAYHCLLAQVQSLQSLRWLPKDLHCYANRVIF